MTGSPGVEVLRGFPASTPDVPSETAVTDHVDACESCQAQLEVLTGDFSLPLAVAPAAVRVPYAPAAGLTLAARYVLGRKIGEGGMGEVWAARQTESVRREVAVKLVKGGTDRRAVLARFEQEREALAPMDHPNIARVFDAGTTPGGQPFFATELVNGRPLTKYCDDARLTVRERLELFVPVCRAVQHAHQKGVVHPDLKPANILVVEVDGRPVPKVIDFGVAKAAAGKLTARTVATQVGLVIGTLEYMAPEQAGDGRDVDTRADIYSLGVVLYELLTGLRPHDGERFREASLGEVLRIIREDEPVVPSARVAAAPAGAAADGPAGPGRPAPRRVGLRGNEMPGEAARPAVRHGHRRGRRVASRKAAGGADAEGREAFREGAGC